jgi:23S rRNA (guanosine2251-2'-O)-methyltransferase
MTWSFGINVTLELLERDPESIHEILLARTERPNPLRERIAELATHHQIPLRTVEPARIRELVGDVVHQGVALRVAEFEYADPATLLAGSGPALIILLDGIQDPHNLVAIARTAAAFGATGIVIPKHGAASVTPVVRKAAAGALPGLPVAKAVNLSRFLTQAKAAGFWTYAADADQAEDFRDTKWAERTVLVMGGEGEGIRHGVRATCDLGVKIPIQTVESLNVSVASAILISAWAGQIPRPPT